MEVISDRWTVISEEQHREFFPDHCSLITRHSQGLRDLLERVALDDVAFLIFVELAEADAALVAVPDFLDLVLEAAQGRHLAVEHRHAAADDAGVGLAVDLAVGDVGTAGLAAGKLEHLADLGVADDLLAGDRVEQPEHGLADLVDEFVDDREELDLDILALRDLRGGAFHLHVEADDDRIRRRGEEDVRLADRADRAVHDLHASEFLDTSSATAT